MVRSGRLNATGSFDGSALILEVGSAVQPENKPAHKAETYEGYLHWFACNVATPGGLAWWTEIGRPFLVAGPVAAVDARLAQGQLLDITQLSVLRLEDSSAGPAP